MAGSTLLKWLTWSQDRKGGSKARMGVVDWEEEVGLGDQRTSEQK